MRKITVFSLAFLLTVSLVSLTTAQPVSDAFFVDGMLYRTVLTPANLPDHGPKDGLFVFDGLNGQTPIGEAKPGDKDYNGGRWQVYVVAFTESGMEAHDPDGDGTVNFQLMSYEAVYEHIGLGHLEMAGMGPSFVCPVIKQ
jgi:hypothetical protein